MIRIRTMAVGMVVSAMALSASAAEKTRTYQINTLVKQGAVQLLGGEKVVVKSALANGVNVVFEDLKPGANWAHPALIKVLAKDGSVLETIATRLPPLQLKDVPGAAKNGLGFAPQDVDGPKFKINTFGGKFKVANPENFYAVLINGSADQRHYNDFSFLYRVLTQVYGYLPKNIFVADSAFIGSAADLDDDKKPDIQYQSTNKGVTDLLTKIKGIVTAKDQLLIATDDHGDTQDGESTLYLYDGNMKASVYAGLVNAIPAGRMLSIHEPCYSGGLVRPTIQPNRAAMAAATNVELSWASMDLNFDEFIYHVIAAFGMQNFDGTPVNADVNGDGKINAKEAFAWSVSHDQRQESPLLEDTADSGFSATIGLGF